MFLDCTAHHICAFVEYAAACHQEAYGAVGERCIFPTINGVVCPAAPYICRWSYGSPAQKYSIRGQNWIVEVNGTPTPSLDVFLQVTIAARQTTVWSHIPRESSAPS